MTRRSFLQTAMSTILSMGFGGLFSSRSAAAAAENILHLRQIVTAQPEKTVMIQWDSPQLLQNVHVEVSRVGGKTEQYAPAYRYLSMDGETQYIYHAEIPVSDGASYRVLYADDATAWIPLTRNAGTPTRALLFSDSQCGESYDVWRDVYHVAWQRHPQADFAAIVGDLTDNGESAWHWRSFFEAMEGTDAPLARHVHVPVLGNHEYYGLNWTAVPPVRYLTTFALPENGSADFRGHYYSFDMGSVHCIVLDTQFLELERRGAALKREQMDWLMRDAAASTAPWKIVLMHKDILSYGEYQTEQETSHGISDVGQIFLDAFDTLGIDLVVTGHVHAYRRRQLRARQTDADGTLYLLAGPAGNEYFDVPAENYDLTAGPNPTPSKVDEMGIPLTRADIDARERAKEPERIFSRGEQTGIVLSSLIFAYGWTQGDLSLVFFCLSFLMFELRKIVQRFSRSYGKSIANAMQGFSIALVLGALAMVLTT